MYSAYKTFSRCVIFTSVHFISNFSPFIPECNFGEWCVIHLYSCFWHFPLSSDTWTPWHPLHFFPAFSSPLCQCIWSVFSFLRTSFSTSCIRVNPFQGVVLSSGQKWFLIIIECVCWLKDGQCIVSWVWRSTILVLISVESAWPQVPQTPCQKPEQGFRIKDGNPGDGLTNIL